MRSQLTRIPGHIEVITGKLAHVHCGVRAHSRSSDVWLPVEHLRSSTGRASNVSDDDQALFLISSSTPKQSGHLEA